MNAILAIALQWGAWVVVGVAFVLILWGIRADRRDYDDITADLDELAGDYHTPADRIAALIRRVDALEAHVAGDEQPSGRHARKAADETGPIDMGRPVPPTIPGIPSARPQVPYTGATAVRKAS